MLKLLFNLGKREDFLRFLDKMLQFNRVLFDYDAKDPGEVHITAWQRELDRRRVV